MELFDRYIHEVGRQLPKKLRPDVEAELRSLLLDTLEDRVSKREGDTEPTQADQIAVLEAFGSPSKVADEYNPHPRYLIGPNLFEAYLTTVIIVGSVTAFGLLIAFVVSVVRQTGIPASVISRFIPETITAIATTLGYITLVFAILERVIPTEEFEGKLDKPWDPRKLPAIKDSDRVNVAQQIAKIAVLVLVLALFNAFPEYVGVGYGRTIGSEFEWHTIPLLNETFITTYMPLLNISWLLAIVLSFVLLLQRRWQWWTRLVDFGLEVYGIYIAYRFLSGPAVIDVNTTLMSGFDSAEVQKLVLTIVLKVLTSVFLVGIIAGTIESIRKLYRVFKTLSAADSSIYR